MCSVKHMQVHQWPGVHSNAEWLAHACLAFVEQQAAQDNDEGVLRASCPALAPYAPSPAKLTADSKCSLDLTSHFGPGTMMHSLHHAFRGRRFEREIREMVSGYPSAGGDGRVPFGDMDILDSKRIHIHSLLHISRPAGGPDYKHECARELHPLYVPTDESTCTPHPKPLCHCVAMESGGTALFDNESVEVHVNARGEVANNAEGPFFKVSVAPVLPEGTHDITAGATGVIGELVQVDAAGRQVEFKNPNDRGDSLCFGEVLLLFHFSHLGEKQVAAYVHYFQLLPPEENRQVQQLPFTCFRRATDADGGAYGVVPIDCMLWMAPIVPEVDPASKVWRLNNDAWL